MPASPLGRWRRKQGIEFSYDLFCASSKGKDIRQIRYSKLSICPVRMIIGPGCLLGYIIIIILLD